MSKGSIKVNKYVYVDSYIYNEERKEKRVR